MSKTKSEKPKVVIILGQTATGKSSLAVRLAHDLNAEIISADSRQVYKGLDIGTGKITKSEMQGVEHHLLSIVSPKRKYTVSQFQKEANKKLDQILRRGKLPIVCGGTAFYIDALSEGMSLPSVKPNAKLRKELEKYNPETLFKILTSLDKVRALDIRNKNEINNKVRLVRAIEIAKALGKVPKTSITASKYEFIKIGLILPEDLLYKRIKKRVHQMFKTGLLAEIEKIKMSGVTNNRLRELGFEYYNPDEERVVLATRQYAKRQMTWWKKDKSIKWFTPSEYAKIKAYVRSNL